MAVLAGELSAHQLIDFLNPLVESDSSRCSVQFGIDIARRRDFNMDDVNATTAASNALWECLPAIQIWFKEAAAEGGVSFGNRGNLVSLQEWQRFCRKVGFASLGLSRSDMTFAFVNGFSSSEAMQEDSVRQDIYEARILEFSQSIIVIAVRARFIVVEPHGSIPKASCCDEATVDAIRQMFSRLSVPTSAHRPPNSVHEPEDTRAPSKSVFAQHFKQFMVRNFDSRDQCSLDQSSFSLPDILPCIRHIFTDISSQLQQNATGAMSPAIGFETTQFWISFCIKARAPELLHMKVVDAVSCILTADPEASQYRRSAPMTLELFSRCLIHLALRSKYLLREDAEALPRANQCGGCAVLAIAFMLITLKQAPEVLSQDTYLNILAASTAAEVNALRSSDSLNIAAANNSAANIDHLLKDPASQLQWPAADRLQLNAALEKLEASCLT
jgi:hypothetical protein